MNKFELFCMIFYVLDAAWDDSKDAVVGEYLSGANPFLFTDIGSADPSVFTEFCKVINKNITLENSYELAQKYINGLGIENLIDAFYTISEKDWIESVRDYLSQDHKGAH